MSKESYFAQYVSPNIIIVPTVSYSPQSTEKNAATHGLSDECDENVLENITSHTNNVNEVVVNTTCNAGPSHHPTSSSFTISNSNPTEVAKTTCHGIKELSTYKYRSRNNLVDLTGFNILKRDSINSISKPKNTMYQLKICGDTIETTDRTENQCLDSNKICQKASECNRKALKESSERRKRSHSEGNPKDNISERTTDMENKMKKYFNHLWTRNVEKIKDKSRKERSVRDFKSSKIRGYSKDSKLESSRSKIKLKTNLSNIVTKPSKSKSSHISKEYFGFERKFTDEYIYRSKSESRLASTSIGKKESTERDDYLSSVAMQRYKDFKKFIRHYKESKIDKQISINSLHDKKNILKSNDTTVSKSKDKKGVENSLSSKINLSRKANTNLHSTEKISSIRSIVQNTKKEPINESHTKYSNEKHDFRSKISRKRTTSDCYSQTKQVIKNQDEQETLVITVEQDINKDSKISKKITPNAKKRKTKKCKKIKLVINIQCENSGESDDSEENVKEYCSSPQDLSFLDDFNIDEIVDSLNSNNNLLKSCNINPIENSSLFNNISEYEKKNCTHKEVKPQERLNNDLSLKTVKEQAQIILIESETDGEDSILDERSIGKTTNIKNELEKRTKAEIEKTIKSQDYVNLCDDSNGGIQDKIKYIDENKHKIDKDFSDTDDVIIVYASDESHGTKDQLQLDCFDDKHLTEKNMFKDNSKIINKKQSTYLGRDIAPSNILKQRNNPKTTVRKSGHTSQKHITTLNNNEIEKLTVNKYKDPIEASLETIFNNTKKVTKENTNQSSVGLNTHVKQERDCIEEYLDIIFHSSKQRTNNNMFNVKDEIVLEEILEQSEVTSGAHTSNLQTVTNNALENNCNDSLNTTDKYINTKVIGKLPEITSKNIQQKSNIKKEFTSTNIDDENIKTEEEKCIQNSVYTTEKLLELVKNVTENNPNIKIDIEQFQKSIEIVTEKAELLQKHKTTTKEAHRNDRALYNKADKKIDNNNIAAPNILNKNNKEKIKYHSQKSENTTNKTFKSSNNREQEALIRIERTRVSGAGKSIKEKAELLKKCDDTSKVSVETLLNNKVDNADIINIVSLNISDKNKSHEKVKNVKCSQAVKKISNIKTTPRNTHDTKITYSKNNVENRSQKSDSTGDKSLEITKTKCEYLTVQTPACESDKKIKENPEHLQKLSSTTSESLSTLNNGLDNKTNNNTESLNMLGKNIKNDKEKEEIRSQKPRDTKNTLNEIEKNNTEEKGFYQIAKTSTNRSNKITKEKPELFHKHNNTDTISNKALQIAKNNKEQNNFIQMEMTTVSKSDKSITEKSDYLEKCKITVQKSAETRKIIEKQLYVNQQDANMQIDIELAKQTSNNIKEKVKSLTSEMMSQNYKSGIKKNLVNIEKDTIAVNISRNTKDNTCNNFVVNNDLEKQSVNISTETSSKADKNIKELAELQECKMTSKLALDKVKNDILQDIQTVEILTSSKKAVPSIKSVVAFDKRLSTAKVEKDSKAKYNETIKSEAICVEANNNLKKTVSQSVEPFKIKEPIQNKASPAKDSDNMDVHISKSETNSYSTIKIEQNNDNSKNKVPCSPGKIQKDETSSRKIEVKCFPKPNPFIENLETRMSNYFGKKFNVMAIIHNGKFSAIYKCKDDKGNMYAVKINNALEQLGLLQKERMLAQLHKYTSNEKSGILHLISGFGYGFGMQRFWCFLTEYYPKNLQQALVENGKSFHIDVVQVLSKQLVAAVIILFNNDIVHSDIKPAHILLNGANNRLKLCGFDRSDYLSRVTILPSTGSLNYRAPELILGCPADHRIDVWATAVVMFEMATKTKLFKGSCNNDILFNHLCTLGAIEMDMIRNSKYRQDYFLGTSYIRWTKNGWKYTIRTIKINDVLREDIFKSYAHDWEGCRTRWQATEDLDKLETFHRLLEQMLILDPRQRLPIQFVEASDFFHDMFT